MIFGSVSTRLGWVLVVGVFLMGGSNWLRRHCRRWVGQMF